MTSVKAIFTSGVSSASTASNMPRATNQKTKNHRMTTVASASLLSFSSFTTAPFLLPLQPTYGRVAPPERQSIRADGSPGMLRREPRAAASSSSPSSFVEQGGHGREGEVEESERESSRSSSTAASSTSSSQSEQDKGTTTGSHIDGAAAEDLELQEEAASFVQAQMPAGQQPPMQAPPPQMQPGGAAPMGGMGGMQQSPQGNFQPAPTDYNAPGMAGAALPAGGAGGNGMGQMQQPGGPMPPPPPPLGTSGTSPSPMGDVASTRVVGVAVMGPATAVSDVPGADAAAPVPPADGAGAAGGDRPTEQPFISLPFGLNETMQIGQFQVKKQYVYLAAGTLGVLFLIFFTWCCSRLRSNETAETIIANAPEQMKFPSGGGSPVDDASSDDFNTGPAGGP
ncbi:unnamed protein product [Amoebophrya sp. A120]|nr:unnamed protein product [Amoebophrya sp. A120]|eukprot:GSA120T00020095001.1